MKIYSSDQLRRASVAVHLALESAAADEIAAMLQQAARDHDARLDLEAWRDRMIDQLHTAAETLREKEAELAALKKQE